MIYLEQHYLHKISDFKGIAKAIFENEEGTFVILETRLGFDITDKAENFKLLYEK